MKNYEQPILVIISCNNQDVITSSVFGSDWQKDETYKNNDTYGETWGF